MKTFFIYEGKIKIFSDKLKVREFTAGRPELQEM